MEDSVTSDTLYFLIAENRLFRSKAKEGWKGWLLKERLRSSKPFFLIHSLEKEFLAHWQAFREKTKRY